MRDEQTVNGTMVREDAQVNSNMPKYPLNTEGRFSAQYLALCPLDGRYAEVGAKLSQYFSEYALVKNRVKVEVYWLKFLIEFVESDILDGYYMSDYIEKTENIYKFFNEEDFLRVKEIERVKNHDVKAVEIFVAEKLKEIGLKDLMSFVHIGCTSEDITNTAYATMISEALNEVWLPTAEVLVDYIANMAIEYEDVPMLAHTHGQPATPTTVGKELTVFVYRMKQSIKHIRDIRPLAKFNGATGNYSALSIAFPHENWQQLAKSFVEEYLGLAFNPVTTQIESHDYICHIMDGIRHFNNVLLDFDVDMWLYISKEYFKQIPVATEVGSSTMPHKVNPIRFENSEANSKMSNAICMELSNELPRSRMQRDLSDSSTQRNIGIAFGYSIQAIEQTLGGLKKVAVNNAKIESDLNSKWEVLGEPIQTMLRKYGIPDAYDQLKKLTRGKDISKEAIHEFIQSLDAISAADKETLLKLTPATYIGLAKEVVEKELL